MSKLKYYDGTNWKVVNGQITGDTLPIGAIVPYGSATAPTNWLVCDGSAVSRTTYAELFAVIGTSFGSGDGSTTFNLPNLKGRVAVGQDTNDTDFDTIGETAGWKDITLGEGNLPWSVPIRKNASGDGFSQMEYGLTGWQWYSNNNFEYGQPFTILQPYQVVCYIIKAKQSAGVVANVSNTYSTSEDDTYSCDYVNNTIDGIIESGTANGGTYIKFFDGTLICRGSLGPITTNAGTGADLTVTLPYNFKDRWFDLTASIVDGQAYWGQIQFSFITLSGSQFKFVVWNNSGGINANQYFSYIAIGRWK